MMSTMIRRPVVASHASSIDSSMNPLEPIEPTGIRRYPSDRKPAQSGKSLANLAHPPQITGRDVQLQFTWISLFISKASNNIKLYNSTTAEQTGWRESRYTDIPSVPVRIRPDPCHNKRSNDRLRYLGFGFNKLRCGRKYLPGRLHVGKSCWSAEKWFFIKRVPGLLSHQGGIHATTSAPQHRQYLHVVIPAKTDIQEK